MNENEKMYYFYVKTCKRCEFFKILRGVNRGHPIMFPSREKIIFKRATKSVM